jgi:hypothetical protein
MGEDVRVDLDVLAAGGQPEQVLCPEGRQISVGCAAGELERRYALFLMWPAGVDNLDAEFVCKVCLGVAEVE